jgi:hypothetical protein
MKYMISQLAFKVIANYATPFNAFNNRSRPNILRFALKRNGITVIVKNQEHS